MQFDPFSLLVLLLLSPFGVLAEKPPNPSEQQMGPLVRFNAPEKATASIILLHGLGNTWNIFGSFPPRFQQQQRFKHINFVLPNAPIRDSPFYHNISGNSEFTQSWFNTSDTGPGDGFDEDQYWQVVDYIQDLVLNETAHGIRPERIIVGGFSQGGMETFGAIASLHTKIGGFVLFSTSLPGILTRFNENLVWTNKKTPIFHGQGLNDTLIPPSQAISTFNVFKGLGFNYNLHFYPGMSHQVDWEANDEDVEKWVEKTIPKKVAQVVCSDYALSRYVWWTRGALRAGSHLLLIRSTICKRM